MEERPLGYRLLRYGLKVATRAANDMVDRVIRKPRADEVAAPRRTFRLRAPKAPVHVVFAGRGEGTVEHGTTILEAATILGVDINHYCGGNCSCGTCRVRVVRGDENLSKRRSNEQMVLGGAQPSGWRLACQTRLFGPAEIHVPRW